MSSSSQAKQPVPVPVLLPLPHNSCLMPRTTPLFARVHNYKMQLAVASVFYYALLQ